MPLSNLLQPHVNRIFLSIVVIGLITGFAPLYFRPVPVKKFENQNQQAASTPALIKPHEIERTWINETYGKLPLSFEKNEGQTDGSVKFLSRGSGFNLFLTPTETVLALKQSDETDREGSNYSVLRMQLKGANTDSKVSGIRELSGKTNYFIGNDPSKWRTNISQYERVHFENVYPGIDMDYYGNQRQLEYDFIVQPGASPEAITLKFDLSTNDEPGIWINEQGDLVIKIDEGVVYKRKPIIFQEVDGSRLIVDGRYLFKGEGEVGFQVTDYDPSKPLVIDPILSYSTYLGGTFEDRGLDIAVDSVGNAYITGNTYSVNFPVINPLQTGLRGTIDVFVTKINSFGTAIIYSTYIGGNDSDQGFSIAVNAGENAFITGETLSADFPLLNPLQATFGSGDRDAFIVKLGSSGNILVYSTYLGGSSQDVGRCIAVDTTGNTYVTGGTNSSDFPTVNPLQVSRDGSNAFVAKLNSSGNALFYSTYLGGNGVDSGLGISADSAGNAYITGSTSSTNFPTAFPLQPTLGGPAKVDAFITKMNPSGALVYSTYLGGSGNDEGLGITVDVTGSAYLTGFTGSFNFPTSNPFQSSLRGSADVFVARLNPTGSQLAFSTYLGGDSGDVGWGIQVDLTGNIYVVGATNSTNFPAVNSLQTNYGGSTDGFVVKISGRSLTFSTYLGGSNNDICQGVGVDLVGNAYVTGTTASTNFPTANPLQGNFGGDIGDAFVAKIGDSGGGGQPTAPLISSFSPVSGQVGDTVTISGSRLSGTTTVLFNGSNATFNNVSDTSVVATVPMGATTGPIVLATSQGIATSANNFTVVVPTAPPTITGFTPISGGVETNVTITGTNFISGGTTVKFNDTNASSVTFVSSTTIKTVVPMGATTGPISVTTANGTAISAEDFIVSDGTCLTVGKLTICADSLKSSGSVFTFTGNVNINGTVYFDSPVTYTSISASTGKIVTKGDIFLKKGGFKKPIISAFSFTINVDGNQGSLFPMVDSLPFNFALGGLVLLSNSTLPIKVVPGGVEVQVTVPIGKKSARIAVFKFTVSFTTTNGVKLISAEVMNGNIVPYLKVLNDLSINYDPNTDSLSGTVSVDFPFLGLKSIKVSLNFIPGCLNSFEFAAELGKAVPLGASGLKLTGFILEVENICEKSNDNFSTFIGGDLGIIGISPKAIELTGIGLGYEYPYRFNIESGSFSLFGSGVANVSGTINIKDPVFVSISGNINFSDLLIGKIELKLDVTNVVFTGKQSGTLQIPDFDCEFDNAKCKIFKNIIIDLFGQLPFSLQSIDTDIEARKNLATGEIEADFKQSFMVGSLKVASVIKYRNGEFSFFVGPNYDDLLELFNDQQASIRPALAGSTRTVTLPQINDVVIFGVAAQTAVPSIFLITPQGNLITPGNVSNFAGVTYKEDAVQKLAYFKVNGMTAGSWTLGEDGLPETELGFEIITPHPIPQTKITSVVKSGNNVNISLNVTPADSNTKISLFYSTEGNGSNGSIIAEGLSAVSNNISAVWDTSQVANGKYYIYARTDDGMNTPLITTFSTPVLVSKSNLQPPTGLTGKRNCSSIILSWVPSPSPAVVGYNVLYTDNAALPGFKFRLAATENNTATIDEIDGSKNYRFSIVGIDSNGDFSIESNSFSYPAATGGKTPTITSFSPTTGSAGTRITINGSNFSGASGVRFNNTCSDFSVVSPTSIVTTVPLGAASGKVSVTNIFGDVTSTANFAVQPRITSFVPINFLPNSSVTIIGTGFIGATSVKFNGLNGNFNVDSDSQITATVPSNVIAGSISVTTPSGTSISTLKYNVIKSPAITSFTPTSGTVGTTVIISGSNFIGTTDVQFNGISASFILNSTTSITATVPSRTTPGKISIINPAGVATSANNFAILPKITSFTPNNGFPGDKISISGTNFTGATTVKFNGVSSTFTVDSDTQIKATVPVIAGPGAITVLTPAGLATSLSPFTINKAPIISSISPISGVVGATITITGSNFIGLLTVKFNGAGAMFNILTATSIRAVVPVGATTGKVSATNPGGTATSAGNFGILPQITSFSPATGLSGAEVTITGTSFTGATAVKFNNVIANFTVVSDSQIRASVPNLTNSGKISVTTLGGTALSSTDFNIIKQPVITGFTPASGPVGATITISGTNVSNPTDLKFGDTSVTGTVIPVTTTSIKVIVPAGATTGKISLTNQAGTGISTNIFKVSPKIVMFAPVSGIAGESVTITGLNLKAGNTDPVVKFGAIAATVGSASDTQAIVSVPPTAITGKLSVTTTDGIGISATDFTVIKVPTITGFTPVSGAVGTSVTISGANLTAATDVKFNGTSITGQITAVSASSIKVVVPIGATTGRIEVLNRAGVAQSSGLFKILPKITGFVPDAALPGENITITGLNFGNNPAVKFGFIVAPVVSHFDNQIIVTVPPTAITSKITVTSVDGSGVSNGTFTVIKPPTISSFTPTSGIIGMEITITGSNLTKLTDVKFNGTSVTNSITFISPTTIKVTVPEGATTGKLTVTNRAGTSPPSTGTFTVLK
jgi:hypothetical protein